MTNTDPITRAAADAIDDCWKLTTETFSQYNQRCAEAVVAAVTPLIRAQIADQITEQVEPTMARSDDHFLSHPARSEFWKGRASGLDRAADIARGDAQ